MKNSRKLSEKRLGWIREQGYFSYTNEKIEELAFGNRFAYRLCLGFLFIGIVTTSIPLLIAMNIIALSSVMLPRHPFDYIYNAFLRKGGPELPKRSPQLKTACTMASIFIASTIASFLTGYIILGYVLGGMLVCVASLVAFFDFCIPSKIYNALFLKKDVLVKVQSQSVAP